MIRNNKGISLVEILVTIALIGVATPIVAVIFMYGLQDYITGSRYLEQQTNINTTYISFRRQYEMAREVKLIHDDSTTGSPIMALAVELKYAPSEGAIDYDDEYRDSFDLENEYSEIEERTNPPYDEDFIAELLAEEAFHTRWEFVEIDDDSSDHPYYYDFADADDRPTVYDLYVMNVADMTEDFIDDMDIGDRPDPVMRNIYAKDEKGNYKDDAEPETGIFYWDSQEKLWLRIIPIPVNRGLFRTRNIIRPIEWHFDYVYKEFDVDYVSP